MLLFDYFHLVNSRQPAEMDKLQYNISEAWTFQGLFEKVGKPTRGEYFSVLATVPDVREVRELPSRLIWQFDDANWEAIENNIATFDWGVLKDGTVNDALAILVDCLETQMQRYVSSKTKEVRKCTLPWLNAKCYEAVRPKHDAENSNEYIQVATECRQVLVAERQKYLAELRTKMEALPRSSKKWWALNKQLLHRQAAPSFFPPLKDSEGTWHRTPIAKANAFAKCWVGKCRLPAEVHEHFFAHVEDKMSTWFPIRRRTVQKFLAGLKVDKATGCCHSEQSFYHLGACFLNLDWSHLGYVSLLKAGADDISPQAAGTKRKRDLSQTEPFVCRLLS